MELAHLKSSSPAQVDFMIEYTDGMNPPPTLLNENFNVAIHGNSIAAQYRQAFSPPPVTNTAAGTVATATTTTTPTYGEAILSNVRTLNAGENAEKIDQQMPANLYWRGNADGGFHSLNIYNHSNANATDFRAYLDYDGGVAQTHEMFRPIPTPAPEVQASMALYNSARLRSMLDHSVKEVEAAGTAIESLGYNFSNDLKNIFHDLATRLEQKNSQWMAEENMLFNKDMGTLERELMELRAIISGQAKIAAAKEKMLESLTTTLAKEKQETEMVRNNGEQKLEEHLSKYELFQTHVADTVYRHRLLQKVFCVLRSQAEASSRSRWEAACKHRAEEVCCQLRNKFHATRVELEEKMEQLKHEKALLLNDKGEYETTVQQALMRGLCSLNMEALKVFNITNIENNVPCKQANELESVTVPSPESVTLEDAPLFPTEQKESTTVQDPARETVIYGPAGQPNPNRFGQRCHMSRHIVTSHHPMTTLTSAAVTRLPRKPVVTSTKKKTTPS